MPFSSSMRIPTVIITGFLGSGKTTLIKRLLDTALSGKKVALIENEIGEVSVDSILLKTANVQISELTAGCMCCTISGDFSNAVSDILETLTPDVLLIETTGIANPISIFMMLANDQRLILDTIMTVADAERLCEHLADNLVAEIQLTICDLVVLNKIDVCSDADIQAAEKAIRQMNERAPIFKTVHGNLPPEIFLASSHRDLRETLRQHIANLKQKYDHDIERRLSQRQTHHDGHHHHHDHTAAESYHLDVDEIQTFAIEISDVVSQRKFELFLADLPRRYYRAKGIINFVEMPNPTVFNFASGRYTFDYDTLAHEQFRETRSSSVLVFIGKRILSERDMIADKLKQCYAFGAAAPDTLR